MRTMVSRWLVGVVLAALAAGGCGFMEPDAYAFWSLYQVQPVEGTAPSPEDLEVIRSIVERRVATTGLASYRVTAEAPDRIVVEGSPIEVAPDVRALATATGRVDFVPLGDVAMGEGDTVDLASFPPLFSGDQVAGAVPGKDEAGQPMVDLTLKDPARQLLAAWTRDHIGEYLGIVLDGRIVMAPVIQEAIPGGQIRVTQVAGDFGIRAQELLTLMQFGQLPYPMQEIDFAVPAG